MRRIIDIGKTEDKEFADSWENFYLVTWREEGVRTEKTGGECLVELSVARLEFSPIGMIAATIYTDTGDLSDDEIRWVTNGDEKSVKFVFHEKKITLTVNPTRHTASLIANGACSRAVLDASYDLMDETVTKRHRFRPSPVEREYSGGEYFGSFFVTGDE